MRINYFFTLLTVFFHFNVKGQDLNDRSKSYVIDCRKVPDSMYRHYKIGGSELQYKVFWIERAAPGSNVNGHIILKNFQRVPKNDRKQLAIQLIKEFKLTTVMFFENCDLVTVYYQAMKHTSEQESQLASGTDFFYAKDIP